MPVTRASICLAMCLSSADAALVADWTADTFVDGANWTSNTGGIVATRTGAPLSLPAYFNGKKAVEFTGIDYFTVPAASNPVAGATAFTMVAVFEPTAFGAAGGSFWQCSGLIGMEQGGDVADWGFGWLGDRINGGVGLPELTMLSEPKPLNQTQIAMMTWNNSGQQRLFVNGVLVDSDLNASTAARNPGDFGLAAITGGGSNPFTGKIAELQIHNTDETANAATIYTALRDKYIAELVLTSAALTTTGGRIVITDTAGSQVNTAGDFVLKIDDVEVPDAAFTVNKVGGVTTIVATLPVEPNTSYFYELSVPRVSGGPQVISGTLQSYRLPLASALPGAAGTPGTWSIREFQTGDAPLPANASTGRM